MKMNSLRLAMLMTLSASCMSVYAMQPLDDQSLSNTTGQDGITIGIGVHEVTAKHIAIIDTNGIKDHATHTSRAGLVIAGQNANDGVKITFNGGQTAASTLNAVIDVDAGSNGSFANIALSFDSAITGITVAPLTIYLAGVNAVSTPTTSKSIFTGGGVLEANVKPLLRLNEAMAINFAPGNAPKANIQLGNTPQGQLIRLSGAIDSICGIDDGCNIQLADGNTGIGFDFQLTGHQEDAATPGGTAPARKMFKLDGFYASVKPEGLEFGNIGDSDKFDTKLNNLTLGTVGQISTAGAFAGIPNGALGNIGLNGVSVTNMKMKVSGF